LQPQQSIETVELKRGANQITILGASEVENHPTAVRVAVFQNFFKEISENSNDL